ncbi:MAG TPA: ectonucleotide pyrophosphatase/phosphodiesterase [Steroidobacteraceae bacterium]|nr:ectonucleotide pyrophosphatase/phosphodiesterase [Steroidobacteraceae bacterium]
MTTHRLRPGSLSAPWRALLALPLFSLWVIAAGNPSRAAPVLMISVDGLKPEYVLEADAHGLKIPFLRGMLRDGAYARGVAGVWPTVTYPSHTTLLTGLSPAEHGIYNNLEFDPKNTFGNAWYWYAQQIRVPTLWQAAHEAGLSTASIGWPVSVGATSVDFLIPEYWRVARLTDVDPSDALLIAAVSRPEGLLQKMQARLGPYMRGNDPSPPGDEIKTRYALDILKNQKPKFMTIHLSSLDEQQHGHGPFSPEANQDLEAIDGQLAQLFAASRANDPKAVAVVVSDHGFVHITHKVNLMQPFMRAGLVQSGGAWQAQPWSGAGMAAVMLHDPADSQVQAQVRGLLQSMKADPNYGIAEVLEGGAIKERGAFPDAAFLIIMNLGYYALADATSPLLSEVQGNQGSHGFSPEYPEMRASFFIAGKGIARHRDLGVIDMRQVAPTVAQLLNVHLPSATRAPLPIHQ